MKNPFPFSTLGCLLLSSLLLAQDSQTAQDHGFTIDKNYQQAALGNKFSKLDGNQDGIISPLDKGPWRNFKDLDSNGDGKIERAEYFAGYGAPENADKVIRNIVYKTAAGKNCLVDIYLPKIAPGEKVPIVYFTHGGGWAAGAKEIRGPVTDLFDHLLGKGIACASANYRLVRVKNLNDEATMLTCVIDCMDGMRFLVKHADALQIDESKILPFGNSAGGHLAMMLSYAPADQFQGDAELASIEPQPLAGLSWYGPVDFTDSDLFVADVDGFDKNPDRYGARMKKGAPSTSHADATDEMKALMEKLSPIRYLKKDSPALLTIHGNLDTTIPQKHSIFLAQQAKEIGADVRYLPVKNAGHGWKNGCDPDWNTIRDTMVEFVIEQTKTQAQNPNE